MAGAFPSSETSGKELREAVEEVRGRRRGVGDRGRESRSERKRRMKEWVEKDGKENIGGRIECKNERKVKEGGD